MAITAVQEHGPLMDMAYRNRLCDVLGLGEVSRLSVALPVLNRFD